VRFEYQVVRFEYQVVRFECQVVRFEYQVVSSLVISDNLCGTLCLLRETLCN